MNCEEILIKSGFSKRKAREHAASLKEVLEQEKQKSSPNKANSADAKSRAAD